VTSAHKYEKGEQEAVKWVREQSRIQVEKIDKAKIFRK
jgi:hypothetical protein